MTLNKNLIINVIGGVYKEICLHPQSDQIFGSGGRAAVAISHMDCDVTLHSYISSRFFKAIKVWTRLKTNLTIKKSDTDEDPTFKYYHSLYLANFPYNVEKK